MADDQGSIASNAECALAHSNRGRPSAVLAELNPVTIGLNKTKPLTCSAVPRGPVHFTLISFGPYWSLTNFADVKFVDTHQELFSSDIANGGIRLGGLSPPSRPRSVPLADVYHANQPAR